MVAKINRFGGGASSAVVASVMVLLLGACASGLSAKDAPTGERKTKQSKIAAAYGPRTSHGWREARIVALRSPLQCVPYARRVSDVAIWGDAWTWWRTAEGRYHKSSAPAVGSILAFKRTRRLRLGHVAVVTKILNKREIVVEHANWLNRGNIHVSTPVVDVSKANDWSKVRVWYTPGKRYGARRYPTLGFIHPELRLSAVYTR